MLAFELQTKLNSIENRQFTCYISLICLQIAVIYVVQSYLLSKFNNIEQLAFEIRLTHFDEKSTINLLYFINMPPLVVIYVVQYIYYQNFSNIECQQSNFRLTHFNRNRQLTCYISLIWLPLIVIYFSLVIFIIKTLDNIEQLAFDFRLTHFDRNCTSNLLYIINMASTNGYLSQFSHIYYQNLITSNSQHSTLD